MYGIYRATHGLVVACSEVTVVMISCSSWNCYGSVVEEEIFLSGASFQLAQTAHHNRRAGVVRPLFLFMPQFPQETVG